MEKRKVFKISIIDKEISRTEFDRNTFYTSDSELTLVFKLIEKDYSYDHGEILLYNENDTSFVTRQITKIDNDFVYELDLDIIPHYGKWQAQLQLVNDGDVYTSKPFDFVIENDLSNLAPQPTLTDINNWGTLKQSANDLIDEMKDIIVDIENAELERASKENYRQKAEFNREKAELKRDYQENKRLNSELKRNKQETKRVENEKERQIAELNRQNVFNDNEDKRSRTFNNNEAVRQENETTRQQAENERVEAESIRVDNENQRNINHENISAEFDGKANKKQEDWKPIPLTNEWKNHLPVYSSAEFYKDNFGIVHFRGQISGGTSPIIGYLPSGYTPEKYEFFLVLANLNSGTTSTRTTALYVAPNGEIRSYLSSNEIGTGYNSLISLSQISYRVKV